MFKNKGLIILTFFIAMALDILPLPMWAQWLRPDWVLLVLIFWVLTSPEHVGVGLAFLLGLILDLLDASLLGEHALAFVCTIYIVSKLQRRWMFFPMIQQMALIFMLLLIYKLVIFAVQGFVAELPSSFLYWVSIIVSVVLWPWLFALLRDCQRKFSTEV